MPPLHFRALIGPPGARRRQPNRDRGCCDNRTGHINEQSLNGCRPRVDTNNAFFHLCHPVALLPPARPVHDHVQVRLRTITAIPDVRSMSSTVTLTILEGSTGKSTGHTLAVARPTEVVSARLVGIETYLVTDYVIGDAASSGADHVSDALGFELGSWRTTEPGGAPRSVQSSMISGILLMRGSVKTSVSSLLVLENSEMTAPSGPDWNQWRVFGGMVYWWPGSSSTSWSTV